MLFCAYDYLPLQKMEFLPEWIRFAPRKILLYIKRYCHDKVACMRVRLHHCRRLRRCHRRVNGDWQTPTQNNENV